MILPTLSNGIQPILLDKVSLALVSWTVFCYIRKIRGDPSALHDLILFAGLEVWSLSRGTQRNNALAITLHLASIATIWIASILRPRATSAVIAIERGTSPGKNVGELPLRPMIFPCKTTHARRFPKSHSFAYSYLYVGIPVGWHGNAGNLLSADTPDKAWLHVSAESYLQRDYPGHGLRSKLEHYLESQKFDARTVPYAYLVTAPAFLGYSFNPVSFWYLYSADLQLRAMILEVNNTFDERRMYLLTPDVESAEKAHANEEDSREAFDLGTSKPRARFSDSWTKDFHVSPFNSRVGTYSMTAENPRPSTPTEKILISNSITLVSSEGHPKLVARVFSDGASIDPAALSFRDALNLLVRWGWVGFLTSPRILLEARKLFFKHKLQLWYRPEVAKGSIARQPTSTEIVLEKLFKQFLASMVQQSSVPLCVVYQAAPGLGRSCTFYSSHEEKARGPERTLEINVVSPSFYSRFVHYARADEAFNREFLYTDSKNQTVSVFNAHLLPCLLSSKHDNPATDRACDKMRGWRDGIRWGLLKQLRCPPPGVAYPESIAGVSDLLSGKEVPPRYFSSMDNFIMRRGDDNAVYTRAVTKLFIAQRFFYGLTPLVTGLELIIRLGLLSYALTTILAVRQVRWDIASVGQLIVGLCAIHIWGLLKGG